MSEVAPEERLWNLMRGALATKAFGLAADLRVADALAAGPRSVADLAQETGADADTLRRILRALASDGVFAEERPGVFANTEASELLCAGGAGRWPEFAHLFAEVCLPAIAAFEARDTEVAFGRAYGTDIWSWFAKHPEERLNFDRAMEGGRAGLADRLAALEWRGDETVVDIGGGSGTLLSELLARRPELRGTVFDLAETNRDEVSLGDRIAFLSGSFFEHAPTGDVYVLSKILHDWDDEHAGQILRCVRAAAPPSARLLVLDSVVPPGNEPAGVKWLDILMFVLQRGRERAESEWHALLEGAGFQVDEIEDGLIQASCR
jgi:O-methyltransferase domain/Dimerisation domain